MSSTSNPLENFDTIASNGFTTPSFDSTTYNSDTPSIFSVDSFASQAEVLGLASNPFTSAAAIPVAIVSGANTQANAATSAAKTEASGLQNAVQSGVSGFFLGLISPRVIAIILGLIFIAGAFLLFVGDDIADGLKKSGIVELAA